MELEVHQMSECEYSSAKNLVMTLLDQDGEEPYQELLNEYVQENPNDRLSWLISDNWDLLLGNTLRGSDVARAIAQLTLELSVDDPFRIGFVSELSKLDIGTVYYCTDNSSFLNRKDYRVLGGHDCPVSAVLSMGTGKMVSGDACGRILAWDSVFPPISREIGSHSSEIAKLAAVDENRLLSVSSDCEVRVWDYRSGIMVNDFTVGEEIINSEIIRGNIFLVNVIRESETELYLGIHEVTKQKRIALKSYDLTNSKWIWEREFEVDGVSSVMPLPDGRILLIRNGSTGYKACMNCKSVLIVDPENGVVDELFDRLAGDCESVLYSIHEMPVVLKKYPGGYELTRHDGSAIQLSDYGRNLLSKNYEPMLFQGLNLLFISEKRQVFLKHPGYLQENAKVFAFSDEQSILRGRFYAGCRKFSLNPEILLYKVIDLVSGEEVFSNTFPSGDESLHTHMPDDETLVVSTPDGHLIARSLVTSEEFVIRNLGIDTDEAINTAQRYDESRIVITDPSGKLILIDTRNTPEPVSESNTAEEVLGAKDNLFFVEGIEGTIAAFDTDSCVKISEFGAFRDGVHGMLHFQGDHFGAWSPEFGFKSWDVRSGKKKHSYKMRDHDLTGVLVLNDDTLLCWGSKVTGGFHWDEARIALFKPVTGKETELLRIKSNRDPFSGNIPFVKHNAIVGQCLELSNGKLLIPPHWGIPYKERTVFDIIVLDRSETGKLMRIPLEGYTPAWIEELSGGILMICTGCWANSKEKRGSRVFFRNMDTGKLLFSSPELEEYVTESVYLSDGVTGVLQSNGLVSLFQINDGIRYLGDKPFEDLLEEEEGFIEKNRKAKEIGRLGRFLHMPGHSSSRDYRWAELWGTFKGNMIAEIEPGYVMAGNPSKLTFALLRSVVQKAFIFDNALVLQDFNGRIGFLRKWKGK